MNERLKIILSQMLTTKSSITGTYLASLLNITSRTVRSDIKLLNDFLTGNGAKIISAQTKGYTLDIANKEQFDSMLRIIYGTGFNASFGIPITKKERVNYILKRLLLADGYLKQEVLADEIFISKSTLQNDLPEIKAKLGLYDIELIKKSGYGFKPVGDEMKIRLCLREVLFDRNQVMLPSFASLNFQNKDGDIIRNIILDETQKNDIILSDIALNNLTIHMLIAVARIKEGNYVNTSKKAVSQVYAQKELRIVKNIVEKINDALDVSFPHSEVMYVALHLLTSKGVSNLNINMSNITDIIDAELLEMTNSILFNIDSELNLNIKDDAELIIALCLHIQSSLNRYEYGMDTTNMMIAEIRKTCPIAFEAGLIAGDTLKKHGIPINIDEMAFLAVHIAVAVERKKVKRLPKKCVIVCGSGFGSAKLLYYKIMNIFKNELEIVDTIEYYKLKDINTDCIDFIISTIPISETVDVPVILINTILNTKDIQKINAYLNCNQSDMLKYFKENIVFFHKDLKSKEEVINFLCPELEKQGYIQDGFQESVFKREAIFSTSYGNLVAIPHPICPLANETIVSVCTLNKSIPWGDESVQLIFMLCIGEKEKNVLEQLYLNLITIIDNIYIVNNLLKCKNYMDFCNVIGALSEH